MGFSGITINANRAAFGLGIGLGAVTIGGAIGCATATTTAGLVAFGILTTLGTALSGASMTAWLSQDTNDFDQYIEKFKKHSSVALVGTVQFVAQTLFQAVVRGIYDGIANSISRKFSRAHS